MPTHGKYAAISQGSKAEAKEAGNVIRMAKRMCIKEKHYIHGVTKESLWQEEKNKLLSLPSVRFNVFRYESFRVSQTGFVSFETNKYGLSPELHNTTVQAKIFHDNIEFYHDKALIAAYRRSYEKNKGFMDWRQYMKTLLKKPGAAEHTRFFTSMPAGWQKYISETSGKERKSALQLLCDMVKDGNSDSCDEILNLAKQSGRSDVDSVKQCYYSLLKDRKRPERSCKIYCVNSQSMVQ